MLKTIAVDDEPLALLILENYCHKNAEVELVKTFTNLKDAAKYLRQFPVDFLLLDIQISRTNGMEFYKNLEDKIPVIFTTAFSEYAVDGFNVSAVDYLLKPFDYERFSEAVQKVKKMYQEAGNEEQSFLSIRADYKLHKIAFQDIIYIEGLDDYVKINLIDQTKIVAKISMKSLLEKLPSNLFVRTHRSYIVQINRVNSVQNKTLFLDEIEIPIGETYKNQVMQYFKF